MITFVNVFWTYCSDYSDDARYFQVSGDEGELCKVLKTRFGGWGENFKRSAVFHTFDNSGVYRKIHAKEVWPT